MSGTAHISQEELALYALQSRPELEAEFAPLTEHLQQCAECRRVLADLRGDISLIGLSAEPAPLPTGARNRYLQRIAADSSARQSSRRAFAFPQLAWAAAAALAFVAVALQFRVTQLDLKLHDASQQIAVLKENSARAQQVMDVLTSHAAQHVLLTADSTTALPVGRAVYVAQSGSLIFQASNLKQIASDKTYELWVVPVNGKPMPAGLFRPDAAGTASVILPALPSGLQAKAFGVTLEKSDGSEAPTLPMVMAGAVPANSGE
jgi:anti-sigma-K factor RskA